MIDNEIIQALECCKGGLCCRCPRLSNGRLTGACMRELITDVLDLINRQQAEIERLNNSAKQWEDTAKDLFISRENIKAEAIKEFVEKLKEDLKSNNYIMSFDRIDNLVKEMVGEQE